MPLPCGSRVWIETHCDLAYSSPEPGERQLLRGNGAPTLIRVDGVAIKANAAGGDLQPVLGLQAAVSVSVPAFSARFLAADGATLAELVYRPERPLDCGAHCWLETLLEVELEDSIRFSATEKARRAR